MTDSAPSGILTYLFTDLEGSTPLWEKHPDLMDAVSARHDALLRAVFAAHGGQVVKTTGDGFHVVFESPAEAVAAALAGQQAVHAADWPAEIGTLRVRMGLHSGESRARDRDYYGTEINRAARIMALGHGGQVLVSAVTAGLARGQLPGEAAFKDLGDHRLKGLEDPIRLYQLDHPTLPADFPPLQSAAEPAHNLPTSLTHFVGREVELTEVKAMLAQTRLLTLLGPGGTGKTRLLLQAAEDLKDGFQDGAWLVELAPLTSPEQVAEKTATVLGVREQGSGPLEESLVAFLRKKELLLLLDNVEHLVGACAELAERLLTGCPGVKIMVTGRESLFIGGETTFQVPSLSLPPAGTADAADLEASAAVQLFLDRARTIRRDFDLTPENAGAVAEIVRHLDGIPLALELAAARLRVLSAEQIAARLGDRFRLLVGGRRTALPRQQTLQALIDWSWNLLDEPEKVLLRRLSVFAGGWRLPDAQQVAGDTQLDEFEVLDNLEALTNKSLVAAEQREDGEDRYRFLESIRQYAQDRLFESGEGAVFRDRHADHFTALVRDLEQAVAETGFIAHMQAIAREMDNFRSAVDWLEEVRPLQMVELVGKLLSLGGQGHWWFPPAQSRRWLDRAIEVARTAEFPEDREADRRLSLGIALSARTAVNFMQGRHVEAVKDGGESIELLRQVNDPGRLAYALASYAFANAFLGRLDEARSTGSEAREIARAVDNLSALGTALGALGAAALMGGDNELAEDVIKEGRAVNKKLGTSWIGLQFFVMEGRFFTTRGELEKARRRYEEAEQAFGDLGERSQLMIVRSELSHVLRRLGLYDQAVDKYVSTIRYFQEVQHEAAIAHSLECFAYVAIAQEEPEPAASLLGAGRALRVRSKNEITIPWEQDDFDQAAAQLKDMLGEPAFEQAFAEGETWSTDEAVDFALRMFS